MAIDGPGAGAADRIRDAAAAAAASFDVREQARSASRALYPVAWAVVFLPTADAELFVIRFGIQVVMGR